MCLAVDGGRSSRATRPASLLALSSSVTMSLSCTAPGFHIRQILVRDSPEAITTCIHASVHMDEHGPCRLTTGEYL